MDAKEYPTLEVASALTGIGLCDIKGGYSKMMEIYSHLLGESIWTHELAHEPTVDAVREEGYRQFPDMPTPAEASADFEAAAAKATAAYGPTVFVHKGAHGRRENPMSTLTAMRPDAEIVPVVID